LADEIKTHLLTPRTRDEGRYQEQMIAFSAKWTRNKRSYRVIMDQVLEMSDYDRAAYVNKVVQTDFAGDVLELGWASFAVENVPLWMMLEWARHRLVWRDFSLEQLSLRAVNGLDLENQSASHPLIQQLTDKYLADLIETMHRHDIKLPNEELRKALTQGVLTHFVIGANLRTWMGFLKQRGSAENDGDGKATPEFQQMCDDMLIDLRFAYPTSFELITPY